RGIVPPLATPLRDRDALDHDGLARLVERLVNAGVAGLFVLGTTGEGPALGYRLRYELVERTCELAAGRIPVLVGVTDTALGEVVALAQFAEGAGAAAVVAAPPYYFPAEPAEVTTYYECLVRESPLPLLLYNIPICTRTAVGLETVRACADMPGVAGVKDSSGDLDYFREVLAIRARRPDWTVLMGPEHLTAQAVRLGADGGVNGGANLAPRLFVDLYRAAAAGDSDRVAPLQRQVERLGAVYGHGAPVAGVIRGIKYGLALLGVCGERLAEPMRPLTAAERAAIRDCLAGLGLEVAAEACQRP